MNQFSIMSCPHPRQPAPTLKERSKRTVKHENRRLIRASRSRCPLHRKRESQRDVIGCETLRSRLRCLMRQGRQTTSPPVFSR